MLAVYMVKNVNEAITEGLRRAGIDCLTASQDSADRAKDPELLQRATDLNRVLVTHDNDFNEITSGWLRIGRDFAGVFYAGQLQVTIGQAIFDLQLISECMTSDEIKNSLLRLPL